MKTFLALVALLSVALAQETDNANYNFQYAVADPVTGDQKSQSETRNGDVVQGYYQLLDPDNTYRTVTYVSDPVGGFRAKVSKGEPTAARAALPAPVPVIPKIAPAPVVVAPKPIVPASAPYVTAASAAYPYYAAYPGYSAYPYAPYPYYNGYYPYYTGDYYSYYKK